MTPGKIAIVQRAARGVTFDTGMLIALERRKAGALALLRACRLSRARITIPAAVVTEWWRGSHGALLEGGTLEPLSIDLAKQAGLLLAKTRKANAVDAIVIASAAQRGDLVATSDASDLVELARHVEHVEVIRV
jgi:predicted nucleic acid-binding protein